MSDFLDSRPQELCLMCGKCCRLATTETPYKELLELAESGNESARDFLKIFEPYSSIEAAREVAPEIVDNILDALKYTPEKIEEITFYKCKHILNNNLCGIYKERPLVCERFPTSPWAVIPPGCGFEGYLFKKREEIKQKIRKQKEALLDLEVILKTLKDPEKIEKVKDAIEKTKELIKNFDKYGASDW